MDRGKVKRQNKKTGRGRMIKKAVMAAVITAIACVMLLFFTGLISVERIRESCRESAEFFYEEELFPLIIDEQFNTRQDNYADSILVNIMYHISEEELFASLIKASYYRPEGESVAVSLWESLQEPKETNVDYFRYWHGSLVLLRPLFVFTGIEGARMALGILLVILTLAVAIIAYRLGAKAVAATYLLGNGIVQIWMCFFCIEYMTTFLIMNVITLLVMTLFVHKKSEQDLKEKVMALMAVSGVVTCFFDFLTTETLTITIPLLFLTILRFQAGELKETKKEIGYLAGCGCIWGLSYGSMFLFKWLLAMAVLGKDAFLAAMSAAGERIGGTVYMGYTNLDPEASLIQKLSGALFRNQGSLFPFKSEMNMGAAMWLFLGVCFLCFAIVYLLRPRKLPVTVIVLCLILAAVPYIRYLALGNHSFIHYFFTYRAQLVTICAVFYCTWQFGLKRIFSRAK